MYRFSEHQKQPMPNMASSMPAGHGGYIDDPFTKCFAPCAGASFKGVSDPVGVPPKKARETFLETLDCGSPTKPRTIQLPTPSKSNEGTRRGHNGRRRVIATLAKETRRII
mmetsp:Transcript_125615/g.250645  ORF Transcript_125615/g.250645 Transcript_125615/m.250645 type:complete len:111 (-) Transcript_125615:43-375(-)